MRIALWSFFIFLSGLLILMPDIEPAWVIPEAYEKFPLFAILGLSFLLQLEGTSYIKLKSKVRLLEDGKKAFETQNTESQKELLVKLETLEGSLKAEKALVFKAENMGRSLESKIESYKSAQKDSQLKLSDLKKELNSKKESTQALTLLSLLQSKGRLLDFLMDDITRYDNEQVGSASRVVHDGCKKVLSEYFAISPLVKEQEGEKITLDKDPSPLFYKTIGTLSETSSSQTGTLLHRGWKTESINLPEDYLKSKTQNIISPAEIELN